MKEKHVAEIKVIQKAIEHEMYPEALQALEAMAQSDDFDREEVRAVVSDLSFARVCQEGGEPWRRCATIRLDALIGAPGARDRLALLYDRIARDAATAAGLPVIEEAAVAPTYGWVVGFAAAPGCESIHHYDGPRAADLRRALDAFDGLMSVESPIAAWPEERLFERLSSIAERWTELASLLMELYSQAGGHEGEDTDTPLGFEWAIVTGTALAEAAARAAHEAPSPREVTNLLLALRWQWAIIRQCVSMRPTAVRLVGEDGLLFDPERFSSAAAEIAAEV